MGLESGRQPQPITLFWPWMSRFPADVDNLSVADKAPVLMLKGSWSKTPQALPCFLCLEQGKVIAVFSAGASFLILWPERTNLASGPHSLYLQNR